MVKKVEVTQNYTMAPVVYALWALYEEAEFDFR